jgi:hypothetical protein
MRRIAAVTLGMALLAAPAWAGEEPSQPRGTKPAKIAWATVLGSVAAYEVWAIKSHNETMSQATQRHTGTRIAVMVGLSALSVHLVWK